MNILFCDDEQIILDLYISELEHAFPDYTFHQAFNGKEALQVINDHKISYVFTDGKMPVMDGVELAKQIKELQDPPIVFMITGYTGTYDEGILKANGIEEIFYKPIDYDWLIEFVGKLEKE